MQDRVAGQGLRPDLFDRAPAPLKPEDPMVGLRRVTYLGPSCADEMRPINHRSPLPSRRAASAYATEPRTVWKPALDRAIRRWPNPPKHSFTCNGSGLV